MKNNRSTLIVVIIISAIAFISAFTPLGKFLTWQTIFPDTPEIAIEKIIDNATLQNLGGIIIYVNRSGKTIFYSSSFKNNQNKILSNKHELFKIGNISKLYILVAATKLINKQLLSLDDTLTELLPELTEKIKNPDKFTVRSLLKIYLNNPAFYEKVKNPTLYNTESLQEIYNIFPYNSYDFDSAIEFNYHNVNTLLVAEIFLRKLGYDYRQYIKNKILIPLKLDNTYNMVSDVDLEKVENGNLLKFSKKMSPFDFIIPEYSMVASAEDLGKFLRALNDGVLLNEEEQIILSSIYNNEHTEGLIRNYQSIAKYHKNIDAVVVQFVNTTNYDSQRKSKIIYNRIIEVLRKDQEKISIKDTCY